MVMENLTIKARFDECLQTTYPDETELNEDQKEILRLAFYAGVSSCIYLLGQGVSVPALRAELVDFMVR